MNMLVLLRHGQSEWNRQDRFTGWIDAPLSEHGERQAYESGAALLRAGLSFDVGYTSILTRAMTSLWRIQLAMQLPYLPVGRTWRLNDRHYGALTGCSKAEVKEQYGADQFHRWRRGFVEAPPPLGDEPQRRLLDALRAVGLPPGDVLPSAESLRDTWQRVLPFWTDALVPSLRANRRVIVVAHGNSLRALVKHIEGIGDDEIETLEMQHGQPLMYRFDSQLNVVEKTALAV
jgi:2,3-bisphosphoglycerate-dependent phosphoglycerate mutase